MARRLPAGAEARDVLVRVGVPEMAIDEICDARPRPGGDAWARVDALHHELTTGSAPALWAAPAAESDATERWLQLWAFLAALPHARAIDVGRGIDEAVTWDTWRDIGVNVERHITAHGRPGFDGAWWLCQHVRGQIYRLGRLQFNLSTVTFDPGAGAGFGSDDPALGVHIPGGEPLTPEACDDSIEWARTFFPRHLDGRRFPVATCASWLLDQQLVPMLGPASNIVRFQERFTEVHGWSRAGDEDVLRFVFGNPRADVDSLPARTTLERGIVDHFRAGQHFQIRLGWLPLHLGTSSS